tara:strand:+ start:1217 stop:2395 length:1179 start_codon:yes stop_codon:yes gene_type:complete
MVYDVCCIILSGGLGKRFSQKTPKQFFEINGKTILEINLEKFKKSKLFSKIVVITDPKYKKRTQKICEKISKNLFFVELGGKTRQLSSNNGCKSLIKYNPKIVLIHDVARPFFDKKILIDLIKNTTKEVGCIPVVKVQDSLTRINKSYQFEAINRENIFHIQTPQSFPFLKILEAHKKTRKISYTDDSSLALANNMKIKTIEGYKENIKITTKDDLKLLKNIYKNMNSNEYITRVGFGYDVHKFTKGNFITLCGIKIPFKKTLEGHSDADVGLHTIVDAILGAISKGDIGRHFPPTDEKWKNASSLIFLEKAKKLLKLEKAKIINIDLTFICEEPKIYNYQCEMVNYLTNHLKIKKNQINIKATTTEKLGFLGRKEGIAAQASVTISMLNAN